MLEDIDLDVSELAQYSCHYICNTESFFNLLIYLPLD